MGGLLLCFTWRPLLDNSKGTISSFIVGQQRLPRENQLQTIAPSSLISSHQLNDPTLLNFDGAYENQVT